MDNQPTTPPSFDHEEHEEHISHNPHHEEHTRVAALATAGVLLLIVVSVGAFFLGQTYKEKQIVKQRPTPTVYVPPTAAPSPTTADETANWKTYTSKYNFLIKYPSNRAATQATLYSTLFNLIQNEPGAPGFPTFYISIIPDNFDNKNTDVYNFESQQTINAFFNAQVGEVINQTSNQDDYHNFKKLPNVIVDGQDAVVVENSNVWEFSGGKDRRVFVKKNGFTYMIGAYYLTEGDLNNFQTFISTFKFTK